MSRTADDVADEKIRRETYKGLTTTHDARRLRMDILEGQAAAIGWHGNTNPLQHPIPPIPYTFTWEQERVYEVRPCRWVDQRKAVWQPHRSNVGRPSFTDSLSTFSGFHIVRQRRAVREDLCGVCGHAVDVSDVLWLNIDDEPLIRDDGWSDLTHSHFHLECVRHTLNGCPFMRAGFGGFAPYKGPVRKTSMSADSGRLLREFGLSVHPDAMTVARLMYQIPGDEMIRLRELAAVACPDGLHWRG